MWQISCGKATISAGDGQMSGFCGLGLLSTELPTYLAIGKCQERELFETGKESHLRHARLAIGISTPQQSKA